MCIRDRVCAAQALAGASTAYGQRLSAEPVFVLNAPFHTGFVLHLAVTPDQRQVITAGLDKTIRIWDALTGQLLRRYFLPLRDAGDGRITALSLSPDGERLAVAGGLFGFGEGKAVAAGSLAVWRVLTRLSGVTPGYLQHPTPPHNACVRPTEAPATYKKK